MIRRPTFATWKEASCRKLHLWEGTGRFSDRLFATLDHQPDGNWRGRYGLEISQTFVTREAAIQYISQRAATEHGVEVRTSTRIIVPRPSSQMIPA